MRLLCQTYAFQRLQSTLPPFLPFHAGECHGKLYVRQNRLMRNQIITLKNKPDGVVAIGIPVTVFVTAGRNTAKSHLAGIVPIQSADDVQQSSLPRSADPFHCNELTFAE